MGNTKKTWETKRCKTQTTKGIAVGHKKEKGGKQQENKLRRKSVETK